MKKIVREGFWILSIFTGICALLTVLDVSDNRTWLALPFVFMSYFCFRTYDILGGNNVEK